MMKKINQLQALLINHWEDFKNNQKGSQTLEWIGIAAVVVILVGVISQAFASDQSIGKLVVKKLKDLIDSIGGN